MLADFNLKKEDLEKLKRAKVIVMCGLPRAGKSWVARRLAAVFGFKILSSDKIRRFEPFSKKKSVGVIRKGRYAVDKIRLVYDELVKRGLDFAKNGEKVILDATFLQLPRKKYFNQIARAVGEKAVVVWVKASEAAVRKRFAQRAEREKDGDFSEADLEVYLWMKKKIKKGEFSYPSEKEGIEVIEITND